MPSNAKEFAAHLRRTVRHAPREAFLRNFREFGFKVLEGSINNSPVNEGQLRGGWHLTIGTPSQADTQSGTSASAVLTAGEGVLNRLQVGDVLWIQNNVPHAPVWEYGLFVPKDPGPSKATHVPKSRRKTVEGVVLVRGGFHVSAPNGMLADAVQQARAFYGAS
jgi:hypothetical protein